MQVLKAVVAEKQKALEERLGGKKNVGNTKSELPKPPSKPSFCSVEDTTQYIFDACLVQVGFSSIKCYSLQNNKVYVGREYARDLTASEIVELKEFDVKQTAYQKYVQDQLSKASGANGTDP